MDRLPLETKSESRTGGGRFCSSDLPRPIPTTHVANDPVPPYDAMRRTIETRSHILLECGTKDREEISSNLGNIQY